jgi:hypothetical protein
MYEHILTPAEIAQNAALDQLRYLTTPEVTIGGKPCTDVAVVSSTELRCTAPAAPNGILGAYDVKVEYDNLSQTLAVAAGKGYTYVSNSSDFYVFSQSLNHGEAGQNIVFTGNHLGNTSVTDVKIGDNSCTSITQSITKLTCTVPAQTDYSNNAQDIVFVTTGDDLTLEQAWTYHTFINLKDLVPATTVAFPLDPLSSAETTADLSYAVTTNNPNGYRVTVNTSSVGTAYNNHPNDLWCSELDQYLPAIQGQVATLPDDTWGYKPFGATNWLVPMVGSQLLHSSSGPTDYNGDYEGKLVIGAKASTTLPACTYTGKITVTVVGG